MKREPGMSLWYCAHGLPRGFEASVFRARGYAPLHASKTYTRMVELAGYPAETGHDENGDSWLWAPAPLVRLIPSGAELRYRVFMCARLGVLDAITRERLFDDIDTTEGVSARERLLIELDASMRLAGYAETGITAVLGKCPTIEEMHDVWTRIFPPAERHRGAVYRGNR